MPTYEYLCQTCSHRFETWQKMTDEPLSDCPECGGHIRRVLFPAGVVFKGSGFYVTDHANGKSNTTTTGETKAGESASSSESSTKSESSSTTSSTGDSSKAAAPTTTTPATK